MKTKHRNKLSKKKYLNAMMKEVSRSFVLVTNCLEEPLDNEMAAAYLICRVVDNIEDCERSASWQKERFDEFKQLITNPKCANIIFNSWDQMDWPGLNPGERKLMGIVDGLRLWEIYGQFPVETRLIITRWAGKMAEGMSRVNNPQKYPNFKRRNGMLILKTAEDYNQYCYYVAGTVGHMGTELAVAHYKIKNSVANRLLANCEACGRALQKTNIIKDFAKDQDRGVCYLPDEWLREVAHAPLSLKGAPLPWKRKVLMDIMHELRDSVDYMLDLPHSATGFRMASLLCLLPAYETISLAAENLEQLFTTEHQVKISRDTMYQCLQSAQVMVNDNDRIVKYSKELSGIIEANLIY